MKQRLSRIEYLLGKDNLEKIQNSKILIVGLGGVGGYTLEALARSGVMNFTLVDSDRFDESNINRQLLCTTDTVGEYKTLVAKERLFAIDKEITVRTYEKFLSEDNIMEIMNEPYDIVVDAIDSLESKVCLLSYCYNNGIKVVSSMGAGLRKDTTKIMVSDISKTSGDPLAKKLRRMLKEKGILSGIPCVYSTESPISTQNNTISSLVTVTGSFGLTLAQIALDELINLS